MEEKEGAMKRRGNDVVEVMKRKWVRMKQVEAEEKRFCGEVEESEIERGSWRTWDGRDGCMDGMGRD